MRGGIITLLCFVIGMSCQSNKVEEQTPEKCALAFMDLLTEYEFEAAAEFCTTMSAKSLLSFSEELAKLDDNARQHILTGFKNDRSSVECTLLSKNEAQCHICCSANQGEAILELVKIDDQWRISSLFDL